MNVRGFPFMSADKGAQIGYKNLIARHDNENHRHDGGYFIEAVHAKEGTEQPYQHRNGTVHIHFGMIAVRDEALGAGLFADIYFVPGHKIVDDDSEERAGGDKGDVF